jgi:2-methylcitrate dehydratase PrpD
LETLQNRIADYVCGLSFDQLPQEVVTRTKAVLAHDLAVAVAGSGAPESLRALEFGRASGGGAGAGRSRVIGTGDELAAVDAAFVNAVMMRSLRQEDSVIPSFIHPGPIVIPAAIAIGESTGATGAELITAVVAGYDVCAKLAGPDWSWNTSRRTPSHVFGAFGAAVAAAKLLGCDRARTATAIAYAGNLAAMITLGFENHQYGVLARNGMTAAFLGAAGAPAPADALEGRHGFYESQLGGVPDDLESRFARCGVDFEIMTSVLKPHPCSAINLVPTMLLQRLLVEHGIAGQSVRRVTIRRSRDCGRVPGGHDHGPWPDASRTTSSLPFALAAVLVDGAVTVERLHDPGSTAILEHARRVHIDPLPTADLLHHVVELTTTDGATVAGEAAAEILRPPEPMRVLGPEGIAVIGTEKARRLFHAVFTLETAASVRDLTDQLIS